MKVAPTHLNYYLAAFFAMQALPFLMLLVHPILALSSSLLICPASVLVLGVLLWYGDAMMRQTKYQVILLLYFLSILWHGNIWHVGLTEGFLE